jgi:NTE family protein
MGKHGAIGYAGDGHCQQRQRGNPMASKPGTAAHADALDGYGGQVVLVLQGGGALGAYQVGVFQAMADAGIEPDWVIGTSIGAVNAAIIAGNSPERRMQRLTEFWDVVRSTNLAFVLGLDSAFFGRQALNWNIAVNGVPGFFRPHGPFQWHPWQTSYYDTAPLAETLGRLIDFDRLNDRQQMRASFGAVNVRTGRMHYFDTREMRLDVRHVMASGSLPPAFPAIEIDGEHYWDGGIYSNTPAEAVMNDRPRVDSLIFSVNLWHGADAVPTSLPKANARAKDIQFASRADHNVEVENKLHRLRHVIRELGMALPEAARGEPEIRELLSWGCHSTMHMLRFHAPRLPDEDASKDIDFSGEGISARWQAGHADGLRALRDKPWNRKAGALDGILVHDI